MIRELRGTVRAVEPEGVVIDVSGFGIYVHMADTSTLSEGAPGLIRTHLSVKQDGFDLFGFTDERDLAFFELTLKVPGVGPKTALSLLRRSPRESLEQAIAARDLSYLTRVIGLGKKAAEKLVIELAEKVGGTTAEAADPKGDDAEVFDTLVALGYTEREARKAVNDIPAGVEGKDARLRAALSAKS